MKTGRNDLKADQVASYLDIAREQGFDAVITISHEVATTPGVHPVAVDKRKLKKVDLFHLSWSRIHTEALIEQTNKTVTDPDQAWILSEFVRYIENSKSGAWDFDDMGPDWVEVRNASSLQTLRASDKETLGVVARFDQLLAFSGMNLSRQLGVNVQQRLHRKERADHPTRIQDQANFLAKTGQLSGSLLVPNAAAPIDIVVDLRANRVDCSAVVSAPSDGRTATTNQLATEATEGCSGQFVGRCNFDTDKGQRPVPFSGCSADSPMLLVENPQADIKSFILTLNHAAGTKRGQGRGSFVSSVTGLVDTFYVGVLQYLKTWSAPPPRPKQPPESDAQEVTPPALADGEESESFTAPDSQQAGTDLSEGSDESSASAN